MTIAALAGGPRPEITAGARTNPVGAAVWGDLWWEVDDGVEVGPGLGVFVLWYELQAQARATIGGGALIAKAQVAAEPGWFLRADARDDGRVFEVRPLGRLQANLNLRTHRVWLYDRLTVWGRVRSFDEYDPFRDAVFERGVEGSIENASALMFSPTGDTPRKTWIYGEATLEATAGIGWINQRAHVGVIFEQLSPGLSLNLDAYYSFMDTRLGGPGVQAILWWAAPR